MNDALFAHGFLTDGDVAYLISSKADLVRSKLHRSTKICDLQLPLEAYYAVLVAIEDHFDIEIDDLVGADCDTLGALMDRLKDRAAGSRRPVALAGGRAVDQRGTGGQISTASEPKVDPDPAMITRDRVIAPRQPHTIALRFQARF
jgi:hypothetical protein